MVSMIDLQKFWVVLNNTALRRMGRANVDFQA